VKRSYNCPECGQVAFIVLSRGVLQCLYCGCAWEFQSLSECDTTEGADRAAEVVMMRGSLDDEALH
jgi:ribosomal protein L37AE/L43A